jgi:thymidylate synthase
MTASGQVTQFKYKPLHKPNQLIYGTGQTAVVTGWTVKGAIAKKLQPHEFAVIGQLYSPTRGISLLIRNLLANPHVRFLVILNATKEDRNAGGCECLLDFFRNGFTEGQSDTGRRCWVIRSPIPGYIDFEIEADALERLRQSVETSVAHSIAEAVSQVQSYALRDTVEPWGSALEFPMAAVVPTVLPGPRTDIGSRGGRLLRLGSRLSIELKQLARFDPLVMMGNGKS